MSYFLQALAAFGAGLGTSLSPCVYPMIPITIGFLGAGVENKKPRVLGFALGQVLAFTALGIAAVLLGELLGFSSEIPWVKFGTGILLLTFAYASFFDRLPGFLRNSAGTGSKSTKGFVGSFLVGVSSAAIASPCTSPVVGGVLTAVSQVENRAWGLSLMFFFAAGMSFLFLILGLGLAKVQSLPKAGSWMTLVHKFSSIVLALGGLYFIGQGLEFI